MPAANGWHRKDTTTEAEAQRRRDYGSRAHRGIRAERVREAHPDDPCSCGCGQPLGDDTSEWHVPHDPARNYLPGLWRGDCNRREAARRGAAIRNGDVSVVRPRTSRTW